MCVSVYVCVVCLCVCTELTCMDSIPALDGGHMLCRWESKKKNVGDVCAFSLVSF